MEIRASKAKLFFAITGDKELSKNLELGCFRHTYHEATKSKIKLNWEDPVFLSLYSSIFTRIYSNIKNEYTLKKIKSGELNALKCALYSDFELNPEINKAEYDIFEKRSQQKEVKFKTSKIYKCKKCGGACHKASVQDRAGDESKSLILRCSVCGSLDKKTF